MSRWLVLLATATLACTAVPMAPPAEPGPPAAIELVTALPDSARLGIPVPLAVRVTDSAGTPLAGVMVAFRQGIGTGLFTPAEAATGTDGIARTSWRVTSRVGLVFGSATAVERLSAFFELITTPAPAAFLSLEGTDSLTAVTGNNPDDGIRVRVTDAFGNGVAGVRLTATASAGFPSLVAGITDAGGYAFPFWQTGSEPGIQTLTVRGPGLNDLIINTIVLPGATERRLAISANRTHACRIRGQGQAECWGDNTNGRLGNRTDQPQVGPAPVADGHNFVSISIGGLNDTQRNGTCGVNVIGETWCWGVAPTGAPPGIPLRLQISQHFLFVELGESHACGLDYEGVAWCWGANTVGQLGVGDNTARGVPTRVDTPATFRDIAVGANHTCGLTRRGEVLCWGLGTSGRLGDGTTTDRTRPTPIASSLRFITLDVGASHACAVALGGGLHCWGSNSNGRVAGDGLQGGPVPAPQPVRPDLRFTRVSAGVSGTCGITTTGTGWCWGSNSAHQLADSLRTQLKPAAPMAGGLTWRQIALGETSGCGLTTNGVTHCWGFNGEGVVGLEDRWRFPSPQPVVGGHAFVDIATGFFHGCGLKADSTTWCWGNNQDSILGTATVSRASSPVRVPSVPVFTAITSANNAACGLTPTGRVRCWGTVSIEDGPAVRTTVPVEVPLPEPATSVQQGWEMGCAILQSQEVWCWGPATGTATPAAEPARVNLPEFLSDVSVGIGQACGRGTSGFGYCWGRRVDAGAPYPVTVLPGGPIYSVVAAGNSGVCVVTVGGENRCTNAGSELAPLATPVPLVTIGRGMYVTCGRTNVSAAVCWGNNEFGQVGRGDLVAFAEPSLVQSNLSWTKLAPATGHTCGLAAGGSAYCWGSAQTGELGNGVSRYFPVPVVVP